MRDDIRRKLDRIDELFPAKRIEASKARIRALKANERPVDRYPCILCDLGFNYYDDVMSPEERLDRSLDEIIAHGMTKDDFIPQFFPGCRVGTIPDMFGAKETVQIDADGRKDYGVCERLLGTDSDPRDLPEPAIWAGSVAAWWLDMQSYVLDETDGRLPVSVIDMQGPMDVAAQLWGYDNLFLDAMGDSRKSSALLEKCTDAFIMLWKKQEERVGDRFVGTHLWGWSWVEEGPGHGASLSMDSLTMISADFFTEHTRDHLTRIAEAFNGLTIHSCGDFSAVVPEISCIPGLEGINSSQMSIRDLIDAGIDKRKYITAMRNLADLKDAYGLTKDQSLNVEITVSGVWPKGAGHPDNWSQSQWDEFHKNEEVMLTYAAV